MATTSPQQQQQAGGTIKNQPMVVTWLIDGNNLRCSRGVPNERGSIIQELQKIASPNNSITTNTTSSDTSSNSSNSSAMVSNVVLVFDGNHNETFQKNISNSTWFQYIITDGTDQQKDRADNYIIEHALPDVKEWDGRVHLVTADKDLGKRARATGIMKGGSLVHPPKFWKQYLPNLQMKQQQQQQQGEG